MRSEAFERRPLSVTRFDGGWLSTRARLIQAAFAAVTAALILGPLVPLLFQSFIDRPIYASDPVLTLGNYTGLLSNAGFHAALLNSLLFATAATAIAVAVGAVQAILIGRTDLPLRAFFASAVIWPLFISPLVLGFGWFILYGPAGYITMSMRGLIGAAPWNLYSIAGMALVAGVSQAPLTVLYCLGSAALADPNMEDAARSCGVAPFRIVRKITLPLMRPALLYSASLIFVNSLEMLAIPLIFGTPVGIQPLTPFLFTQAFGGMDANYGIVGATAMFLLLVVAGLVWLQNRLLINGRRFNSVSGKATARGCCIWARCDGRCSC